MVERKKGKKRKEEYVAPGEDIIDKPSKDEYNVAKWLLKNVPIKKTKFLNHTVSYFTSVKAIDALLDSKYAKGDDALFTTREEIVDFMQVMLDHKLFHRARKIPVSEQELRGKKKDKKSIDSNDDKKKDEKKDKEKEKGTDAESSVVEGKQEGTVDKEKRKRKIRLDMHNDQRFVDGLDAYVWLYDPIPIHYWIIGALLVLGAIGVCLFPLWPPSVRLGVYYLSVAAAGFLVFIILLVFVRLIIFCLVWIVTAGRHHIWILPNLTEDVGLLASFWPLYKYEYKGDNSNNGSKKKKKDKDSDAEDDDKCSDKYDKAPDTPSKSQSVKDGAVEDDRQSENGSESVNQVENQAASESESESSQRSSTGRDFEMVDRDDLET